jgi:hypothetical protein
MNISDPSNPIQPAATLSTVLGLWNPLRTMARTRRQTESHIIPDARLRSLDVIVGSFRHLYNNDLAQSQRARECWSGWEEREQQKFEIRLSERDDESKADIATVQCVELEALRARLGVDVPLNHWQEIQLKEVTSRALHGSALERHTDFVLDPEMVRPMNLSFPSG